MKQLKNVPAIRFKDNKIDWNNVKLGTFSKFRRGSFPQPYGLKKWYGGDGAKPFVQVVDVTKNLNLVGKTKQTISVLAQTKSILACKGKIVVTLQGSIGRVAILQYDAYVDRTLLIFEDFQNETNEYFWAYSIQNIFEIEKTKAPGAIIKTITKEALSSFLISIPNLTEQTQIGNFFKTLDEQISLQEQKHQKLINLKKAMLEKMFPKEGADVPEIRFKGFTEKWEVKKLIEYLEVSKDKNKNLEYCKNDVLSVSGEFGIVNQIALQGRSFAGASVANYGIVRVGEIVYTKSPLKKNPFGIIKTNRFQTGIVSTLYAIYSAKNNVDSTFVEYYFAKDDRLNKYLNPLISKGAKNDMKVSDENALKGKVIFPKSKEEQKCIAKYFTQLDNLINVSTEQLNKFKNIKQALLQKMFV